MSKFTPYALPFRCTYQVPTCMLLSHLHHTFSPLHPSWLDRPKNIQSAVSHNVQLLILQYSAGSNCVHIISSPLSIQIFSVHVSPQILNARQMWWSGNGERYTTINFNLFPLLDTEWPSSVLCILGHQCDEDITNNFLTWRLALSTLTPVDIGFRVDSSHQMGDTTEILNTQKYVF
jgi:hypothetical protein